MPARTSPALAPSPTASAGRSHDTANRAATTCTGARRRSDSSLVGQLNAEWAALCADPATVVAVASWARRDIALARCASLSDIEHAVNSSTGQRTDDVLLALLRLGQAGETLATRTVFQLMLGKAVRIAAGRAGRDTRTDLEDVAVTTLWTVIATYPVDRRPAKVAANIAMDTLRHTVAELTHQRHETPASPDTLSQVASRPVGADPVTAGHARTDSVGAVNPYDQSPDEPADLELLNLLAWAVDRRTITAQEATLIVDIYVPGPGRQGGAAAATRHGLTWPAARQRASRAIRKITHAVRADVVPAAA